MIDEKRLIDDIENRLKYWENQAALYDEAGDTVNMDIFDGKALELRCLIMLIKKQPKVSEWITCSERLPKKGGKDIWYLVNVKDGRKPYEILNYHTEYKMFCDIERDRFLGDHIRGTAYMWQPLPEPWRGKEA